MFLNFKSLACVLGVILLKLLLVTQAQQTVAANGIGVPLVLGEKQYFVQKVAKVSFYKAMQICASLSMTLASIESATEQQNLKSYLYSNSALSLQYWLSGNDLPLSREFVWFGTGSLFSYTSWASGIKTNLNQRCVRTDGSFNWRRDNCSSAHYFICERPVLPPCGANGTCIKKSWGLY